MIKFSPDLKIFQSQLLNDPQCFSGFSTNVLGDSKSPDTVINFFKKQKTNYQKIILLEQIHSVNVKVLDKLNDTVLETIAETDGVITKKSGIVLVVRNADCVPLLVRDKITGYVGISHQGWRGSLKNMAKKMTETFVSLGSDAKNINCALGPAIGACCYEVDDDHYYEFLENYEEYAGRIFLKRKGRWHINLSYLNFLQLVAAGVRKENIEFFPFCTKCDEDRFFSRRRSGLKYFAEMFNFIVKLR